MIPIIYHHIILKLQKMIKSTVILFQKMYVLSVVYKAHVFQTNMNVFKDLLKKQKITFI